MQRLAESWSPRLWARQSEITHRAGEPGRLVLWLKLGQSLNRQEACRGHGAVGGGLDLAIAGEDESPSQGSEGFEGLGWEGGRSYQGP